MIRKDAERVAAEMVAKATAHYEEQARQCADEIARVRIICRQWIESGTYKKRDQEYPRIQTKALSESYRLSIWHDRLS